MKSVDNPIKSPSSITLPEHRARKRFGQNFLHDRGVIEHIIHAIAPQSDQHIVEVGPGQAALTSHLVASGARLDAVELDRDLADWLEQRFASEANFHLHRGDVLKFDLATLTSEPRRLRIVGNLPYNISTPCLFHLLNHEPLIDDMTFMLQREVVERLAAVSGDDAYGRLSITVQYHCQVDHLFDVAPGAFTPPPKVTSAIVRLRPHREKQFTANDPVLFQRLVRDAFSQRRKTLKNALKGLISDIRPEDLPVDLSCRPENLSVADFVQLTNAVDNARAQA